jgi:hypothetical protein
MSHGMAHPVTPFPTAQVTGEPAAMVTRSRVILVLGNQRYAVDFTAEARPLPPQRASVTPLDRTPPGATERPIPPSPRRYRQAKASEPG